MKNSSGIVVGFANQQDVTGGAFLEEAFVWSRRGGVHGLGWLDGDVRSQALGINDRGQIVGLSRGSDGDTAVIWHGHRPVDLNDLAPDYDGQLAFANDVNNAGVITGQAVTADGDRVAFIATPTR